MAVGEPTSSVSRRLGVRGMASLLAPMGSEIREEIRLDLCIGEFPNEFFTFANDVNG